MTQEQKEQVYALCIENRDCDDLEKRRIYKILPDETAAEEGYLRVIDESGEDYLYPISYFVIGQLPLKTQEAFVVASLLPRRAQQVRNYPSNSEKKRRQEYPLSSVGI